MAYEETNWTNGDLITAQKLNKIESGVQSVNSSYTPTVWANGDLITADKLNKIESGIASGGGEISTAEVTFINSGSYPYQVAMPVVWTESGTSYIISNVVEIVSNNTVTVPLYDGHLMLMGNSFSNIDFDVMPTVTGDISMESVGIDITGDGTFTCAGVASFSTAEVTITNDSSVNLIVASIYEDEYGAFSVPNVHFLEGVATVILYEGKAQLLIDGDYEGLTVRTSGSISYELGVADITGDGTITILDHSIPEE